MANISILFFEIILLLLFTFIIGNEEFDNCPQIKEFEKIKVSKPNYIFQFQYNPKENESIVYSDLVLHLENKLNVNYQPVIKINLVNDDHKIESFLVNISDSSSIYLDKSIIPDITKKFLLVFLLYIINLIIVLKIKYNFLMNIIFQKVMNIWNFIYFSLIMKYHLI